MSSDRRQRVALAVDPTNPTSAGALTSLVALLRRDPRRWAETLIVVPALDAPAAQRLVDHALSGYPPEVSATVSVEPVALYLDRGHDTALSTRGPLSGLIERVIAFATGEPSTTGTEVEPAPAQVVADLAHLTRPDPPVGEPSPRVSALLSPDMMLTTTSWGAKIALDPNDVSLTPDIVLHGHYDPVLLRFIDLTVRPGDVCVDVGANVGLFALRMAELVGPTGFVHAFEPVDRVRNLCATTLQINDVTSWCLVDDRAASDSDGAAILHVSNRAQGNSSLVGKTDDYRRRFPLDESAGTAVTTVRLDTALARRFHSVVKIDVEGAERRVLDGMAGLIEAGLVGTVLIELVRNNAPDDWPALVAALERLGKSGARFSRLDVSGRRVREPLDHLLDRQPMPHLVIDLVDR